MGQRSHQNCSLGARRRRWQLWKETSAHGFDFKRHSPSLCIVWMGFGWFDSVHRERPVGGHEPEATAPSRVDVSEENSRGNHVRRHMLTTPLHPRGLGREGVCVWWGAGGGDTHTHTKPTDAPSLGRGLHLPRGTSAARWRGLSCYPEEVPVTHYIFGTFSFVRQHGPPTGERKKDNKSVLIRARLGPLH